MQPEHAIRRIARKEVTQFFASPVAFVFLATFLAVTLFAFFWVDAFFARNIADVRPLFSWMPLLLVFLVAALTMRMWSEERRQGTLEFLLTTPVSTLRLVLGKFLACMALLAIALALTLPLPVTVSFLGKLDWGPVIGGYIATLFLGAAYIAIGLYVSARSESQIVSLIVTSLVGVLLYLLGSGPQVGLFSYDVAEVMRKLGTGSRFESITRGVIDVRDLYYYLSLVGVFLTLNVLALKKEGWAKDNHAGTHRQWHLFAGLLIANLLLGNVWLDQVKSLRADLTADKRYSLSSVTENYLDQLQEPLLIRGYFSAKTHPLLAPLVPQLRDLLKEYEVLGDGKVRVEFVDPQSDPEKEDEANSKYNIKPVPFQVADRYQAGLVNAYFHVLLSYGDQYEVLSFRDLIEVKEKGEGELDVRLRNPEYDVTRALRKVLYAYQTGGNLFATLKKPVQFHAYVSPDSKLPAELVPFRATLEKVLKETADKAGDRLTWTVEDPDAKGGELGRKLTEEFGIQPMLRSLLGTDTFWFTLMLTDGDQYVQLALPEQLDEEGLRKNLEAGLKRFSAGFTKTIGMLAPEQPQGPYAQFNPAPGFNMLRQKLMESATVRDVDLKDGKVPADLDVLLVLAPRELTELQQYAIDQFLMRGGTVLVAASPFSTELTARNLSAREQKTGLEDWLAHHGLTLEKHLVADPYNSRFPVPVTRRVGQFQFQEVRLLDYPFFIDARDDRLNQDHPTTKGLPQVTLAWASPIKVDDSKQQGRTLTTLITSSDQAWLTDGEDITPRMDNGQLSPWQPEGERGRYTLGVMLEGVFTSAFEGKDNPLLAAARKKAEAAAQKEKDKDKAETDTAQEEERVPPFVSKSPDAARLFVFGSGEFLADQTIQLTSSTERALYLNSLQLIQNAVDWALEDRGLLAIRSRSQFANTLIPMDQDTQAFWEYLNYVLAALGVALVYALFRWTQRRRLQAYARMLNLEV